MNVNNNSNYKEIIYNLEILETSIKEGKTKDIDIGFIEIFASDIASLNTRSISQQLLGRLSHAAEKIYEIHETIFFPSNPNDTIRPLVGERISCSTLAKEYSAGHVKKGLEDLAPHFAMRPVAGDGHCLFRSTAVGILEFLQKTSPNNQQKFFNHLETTVNTLKTKRPELKSKYDLTLQLIKKINSKATSPEQVLKNRQDSDTLVDFLRDLACTYNEVYGNGVFESEAIVESGNKKEYLKTMRDMQQAELGGHPEILALNKVLGIDLTILDTRAIGKGDAKVEDLIAQAKRSALPIFLLFRPGHYDYAFSR